jgi:hypothetical protein
MPGKDSAIGAGVARDASPHLGHRRPGAPWAEPGQTRHNYRSAHDFRPWHCGCYFCGATDAG